MKVSYKWAVDRALAHEICSVCSKQNLRVEILDISSLISMCDSCDGITTFRVTFADYKTGSKVVKSSKVEALLERL
jgi:hypothetical protein